MIGYCSLLVRHPYAVVNVVTFLVAACAVVTVFFGHLPNFNDPSLGFESRGTAISNRAAAWQAMLEATRPSGPLIVNPLAQQLRQLPQQPLIEFSKSHKHGLRNNTFHKLKHTHMVCIEQIKGDFSVQPNCSREDLQMLHKLRSTNDEDITIAPNYYDSFDNTNNYSSYSLSNLSVSNVSVKNPSVTQRSPIEKLRLIGLEHDHRHQNNSKDYLIDHEPISEYAMDYDYDDFNESDGEHDHAHTEPEGFFCNPLVTGYAHVVVGVTGSECPQYSGFASFIMPDDTSRHVSGGNDSLHLASDSLLSLSNLKSLCTLDEKIREVPTFSRLCQESSSGVCCPSWSIPNYIALLTNKSHCGLIEQRDVDYVRQLLRSCMRHFDLGLAGGCGSRCASLPPACMMHDAVYTILHYLADVHFMEQQELSSTLDGSLSPSWLSLRTSALFLPVARSSDSLPFYEQLVKISLTQGNVSVISMQLGVKNALFDKLLVADAVLVMAAGVAVFLLVLLYTASFLVTFFTVATIASSLLLAYCVYTFIFCIEFFPYMNVLACIIAVALGADDVFVFCCVWRSVQREMGTENMEEFMKKMMHHAASSVTVTSLTTAAAFLASTTSAITAIKCFSLFTGFVVLANLLLMLTWVPASLVIVERWRSCCSPLPVSSSSNTSGVSGPVSKSSFSSATAQHHNPAFTSRAAPLTSLPENNTPSTSFIPLDNTHVLTHHSPSTSPPHSASNSPRSPNSLHSSHSVSQSPPRSPATVVPASPIKPRSDCFSTLFSILNVIHSNVFERLLPWLIIKPRLLWVVLMFGFAVFSSILVFYYPGLRLPNSADFQVFNKDHYLERYDLNHKYNFWFERHLRNDVANRLPIRIVWGMMPVDNGDQLNPASESTPVFDPSFDLAAPESQTWLLKFCQDLRRQPFYLSTLGPLLPNCFIETLKSWMEERRCADSFQNRYPCCDMVQFPYPRWVFNKCVVEAVNVLYQTPRFYFVPGVAGPKFNKTTGKIAALVVEYDSTAIWSMSYEQMRSFFSEVEEWTTSQLARAPNGLKGGWFTSHLEFYEVQRSLLEGTKIAVLVAMVVSLAVLMLTTLNMLVSLIAVVSVASIIIVTLAILVVLGWHLNILESTIVTAAIGLAVDLTLHFAIAYTKAPRGKRLASTKWALIRMGSPVFMTTLTTLAAAIAMLPATVLAYFHVATFLLINASISFLYSTFFFLPLMSFIGPDESCKEICKPSLECSQFCLCRDNANQDKRVYQQACASESTLSTSSVCPSAPYSCHHYSADYEAGPCITCLNSSHELEPLTSPSLSGPVSFSQQTTPKNAFRPNSTPKMSTRRKLHQQRSCGPAMVGVCGAQVHKRCHKESSCPLHPNSCEQVDQQQPASLGLIVSIQHSRRQSRQQHKRRTQQNGSCAQLVVRKESTESQGSVSTDAVCVCRSASLGSRPSRSDAETETVVADTASSTGAAADDCQMPTVCPVRIKDSHKRGVAKQHSSPQITPANSVSTLVCSEPDVELDAYTHHETLRTQVEGKNCFAAAECQQYSAAQQPSYSTQQISNFHQLQRQKLFLKQHNQGQVMSTDTTSASMV